MICDILGVERRGLRITMLLSSRNGWMKSIGFPSSVNIDGVLALELP